MLIPDNERAKREAALDAAILLLWRQPFFTPGSWNSRDAEAAVAALMLLHLGSAYRYSATLTFDALGRIPPFNADRWAERYSEKFAHDLVGRMRDQFDEFKGDPDKLATLKTARRAEDIAVTELTKALSAGKMDGRDAVAKDKGTKPRTLYWFTADDAMVCSICRPLHRTGERVWSKRFPDGPPAHPNCRCDLEFH